MVTTYDIAKKAGVSQATVSRVLNGSPSVNPETKQKVMEWVRKLDYQPNRIARSLSKKRSNLLGLIIPDVTNPYFSEILKTTEQAADLNGYNIIFCDSRGNLQKEKQCINVLRSHQVDGVLLAPVSKAASHLNIPRQCTMPVVAITEDVETLDSVCVLHTRGGALVAQHLVELGHTQIAFLGPRDNEKCQGLREALMQRGLSLPDEHVIDLEGKWSQLTFHEIHTKLNAYLEQYTRFPVTALFTLNDVVARCAIGILQEHGYAIPHDIAVVGFDNTFLASELNPQLTSVAQPIAEIGRIAMETLLGRISGENTGPPTKIGLEPTLVVRKSTRKGQGL